MTHESAWTIGTDCSRIGKRCI